MNTVRMTHKDLPDQPIDVLPPAVGHHEKSGWVVADDQSQTSREVAAGQPGTPAGSTPAAAATPDTSKPAITDRRPAAKTEGTS